MEPGLSHGHPKSEAGPYTLYLPPSPATSGANLMFKPHVTAALCTLVSLVTWVLPLLYSHHPHCLPLLLVTYPLGEAQGSAQLET